MPAVRSWIMMSIVLPWFNVLSTAVSNGLMEAAVTKTAAHVGATQFQHAGSTIADLPTVRAFVARMRIATDQNKALLSDTLDAIAKARPDATLRVLECKAAAGESAAMVTDLAMRVCGGAAFPPPPSSHDPRNCLSSASSCAAATCVCVSSAGRFVISMAARTRRLKNGSLAAPETVSRPAAASHSASSPRVSIGMAVSRCTLNASRRRYAAAAKAAATFPALAA